MNCSTPGLPVHYQLPEFTQTHVHRVGDAIQLSHPLSSPSPPAPNPSQHQSFPMSQLFAWGGQRIGSFSFSISPSNEHPGLISFRMDWLDLLAVQGILRSLLQHHSSKASMLRCSAFFTVQLLQPFIVVSQNSGPGGPVDSARVSWATTMSRALCWTEEGGQRWPECSEDPRGRAHGLGGVIGMYTKVGKIARKKVMVWC